MSEEVYSNSVGSKTKKMPRTKMRSSELSPSSTSFQPETVDEQAELELEAYSSFWFDDEMMRLNNLNLINASARYDLLTANQQLIDFKLNQAAHKTKSPECHKERLDLDSQNQKRKTYENPVVVMKRNRQMC